MSENRNVPKLRFPEYTNGTGTSLIKHHFFRDLFLFSTGKNIKQSEASPEFEIPCVRYGELYHMYKEVINKVVNKTNLDESELLFSEGDEILLPSAGEDPLDIGSASALTVQNVAIGRTINILRPKHESTYSPIFVSYYINQQLKEKISSLAKGVSISNVYNSDLKTLEIFLPSLPEQQKMAEFLTAVDRRIELLQAKKEKLEAYKKGVMQKIFTQKLRFKADDGSEFPDWEGKKLGEIYEFRTTNSLSRDKLNYVSGEFRNIHYGDIHTKFPTLLDLEKVELPFVNEDVEIRKTFSDNMVEDGDLLIADASEDYADIGKTIEVVNVNGQKVLAGLHTLHAKPKRNTTELGFGGYLMKSDGLRTQIMKISQGTKVLSISVPRMKELDLTLPYSKEQKKIVHFLTNLDRSIENLNQQITHTQTWKKGLLQKMFI